MRRLLLLVAALAVAIAVAVPATAGTRSVRVGDDFFSPTTVTVKRGSTVAWRFTGRKVHTVTVRRGPVRFASKARASGTYRKKLTRRGTYRIVCLIHPGQTMTLRVR